MDPAPALESGAADQEGTAAPCPGLLRAARLLLVAGWLAYAAALVLPASQNLPGYLALVASVATAVGALVYPGDAPWYEASLVLPNVMMVCCLPALRNWKRRSAVLEVLSALSALGAGIALFLPVYLRWHPIDVSGCGEFTKTYFSLEIGAWAWMAASTLSAAGVIVACVRARRLTR